jgi:hypothetical protein
MFGRKAVAIATASIFGLGLLGSAAVAALSPVGGGVVTEQSAAASADAKGPKPGAPDKIKALLDGLVTKGVITQAQEDAILAAFKDAAGKHNDRGDALHRILTGLFEQSATYLGITPADLKTKLPGTSLAAIANATPGKSRDGLVAALTQASTAAIDKALADKKITQEQADKAKAGLAKHLAEFVDRTYPKVEHRAVTPKVEAFIGDAVTAAKDYLGVPATDLMTALRAGKSLGEIADSIPGKSRQGLITAITSAANEKINKAAADGKITVEQAATLNAAVTNAVTKLVDRKMTTTNTTGRTPGR